MKNIKIGVRLISGFILIAILTVNIGLIGYFSLLKIKQFLDITSNNSLPSIEALAQVRYNFTRLISAQRALLIPSNLTSIRDEQYKFIDVFRKAYNDGLQKFDSIKHSDDENNAMVELKNSIEKAKIENDTIFSYIKEWEKNPEKMDILTRATELAMGKARISNNELFENIGKLIDITRRNSDSNRKIGDETANKNIMWMIVFMITTPILALVAGIYMTYSIMTPLRKEVVFATAVAEGNLRENLDVHQKDEIGQLADELRIMVSTLNEKINEAEEKSAQAAEQAEKARLATQEADTARAKAEHAKAEGMLHAASKLEGVVEILTSASEQLSAQVEQSSRGAEEQSQRVSETATAMEEMNATVLEVAKSASHAAETADRARSKAQEGDGVVDQVVASIGQVQTQAYEVKEGMGILGKQAQDIGQIMNVISDIADQTNLLALNAAIEAARAGDAGRGFAVVADEVRKLAEKTMSATKEVGESIGGIQNGTRKNIDNVDRAAKAIEEATVLANKSGSSLKEIVTLVEQASDQVRSIATASEEQSSASEEINRSIEQVSSISSETSQAMNQAAEAVSELAKQAQVLQSLISDMKTEAGAIPQDAQQVVPSNTMRAITS